MTTSLESGGIAPGTEVDWADIAPGDVDTVMRILTGEIELYTEDSADVAEQIMRRILSAQDADAVLSPIAGTTGTKDLVGVKLLVEDFHLQPSTLEGADVYAVADCVRLDTGEKLAVSTSASTILAQLARLKWLDALPAAVVVVAAKKPTKSGFLPLHLERVEVI